MNVLAEMRPISMVVKERRGRRRPFYRAVLDSITVIQLLSVLPRKVNCTPETIQMLERIKVPEI